MLSAASTGQPCTTHPVRVAGGSLLVQHRAMPMGRDDADTDLVAAARRGDRAAFETLLRRHYDRIHGLAWQLIGSRADADDVAQDVCCTLVERLAEFRGDAKFTTWLTSIVFNACRDARRRRRSFQGLTEQFGVWSGLSRGPDGRDLHDAMWVKGAVARLKPAYRDAVVLVAGQQLSHAEAAAVLGVAEATISWRMHEARRLLTGG
ncbi:sigma-70 family RNA polymerase sigma factor [Sphingomonas sp. SUN019]|uniref:RNA polymerase sigma factor n=1 Tax=Sphingomonas sp. SUN019 TaxID=2937788 RepID=UPI0021648BBF|nr:sigma-70 family RNA polymerase sigma factor [Sphingomonas sp. SUN019]UVO51739.1 sigma-70 family RNA polymerase sigma factor [Sphingomonas sp. SUN019]